MNDKKLLKNLKDGESCDVCSGKAEVWFKHNLLFLFECHEYGQPSFDSSYGKHAIDYLFARIQEWT